MVELRPEAVEAAAKAIQMERFKGTKSEVWPPPFGDQQRFREATCAIAAFCEAEGLTVEGEETKDYGDYGIEPRVIARRQRLMGPWRAVGEKRPRDPTHTQR